MTPISYQLYSSRKFGPLADTLAMLAGAGYAHVEGFGGLYEDADDAAVEALRGALDEAGLAMPTAHFSLAFLEERGDRAVAMARTLGIRAVFAPFLMPGERPSDAEGWTAVGRRLGEAGRRLRGEGLAFGWHNHDFEFEKADGRFPLDLVLEADGETALELDLAWVLRAGEDPLHWLEKHSGRVLAVHVKDVAPEGEKADEDGWADVGHGTMDWERLMAVIRETPAEHLVVEHDNPSDDRRFAENSIAALRGLPGAGA